MRINLLIDDPGGVRSGFVNVDTFASAESEDPIKGEVFDLDWLADDAEATEIVALGILDYVAHGKVGDVVKGWLRKLAPGGKLTISVTDIEDVATRVVNGQLSIEGACDVLFGGQCSPWDHKKSGFSLGTVANALEGAGFKILLKRVENYHCVVTCQRP